jgi:hypothetical protein
MWESRLIWFIVLITVILLLRYKGFLEGDDDFGM